MSTRLTLCAAALVAAAFVSGCTTTTIVPNYVGPGIAPQYEFVGDATGSAEGTIILGLFTLGVPKEFCSGPVASGGGLSLLPASPCAVERNAFYKAFKMVPTADALVYPVMTITETDYIVVKFKKVEVRAKAAMFKANPVPAVK